MCKIVRMGQQSWCVGVGLKKTWLSGAPPAEPGQAEVPQRLLVLEMCILLSLPPPRSYLKGAALSSNMVTWWWLSGLCMWLNPVQDPVSTFRVQEAGCGNLFILLPPKVSFVYKILSFLNLTPTHLEWSALSSSFPTLSKPGLQGRLQMTARSFRGCKQQDRTT